MSRILTDEIRHMQRRDPRYEKSTKRENGDEHVVCGSPKGGWLGDREEGPVCGGSRKGKGPQG